MTTQPHYIGLPGNELAEMTMDKPTPKLVVTSIGIIGSGSFLDKKSEYDKAITSAPRIKAEGFTVEVGRRYDTGKDVEIRHYYQSAKNSPWYEYDPTAAPWIHNANTTKRVLAFFICNEESKEERKMVDNPKVTVIGSGVKKETQEDMWKEVIDISFPNSVRSERVKTLSEIFTIARK
jgi:hypothetical protein